MTVRLTRVPNSSPAGIGRRIIAASAIAAAASLTVGGIATAAPAPAKPTVNEHALRSLGAFAPAIIGSAATPDAHGKVNGDLLKQARTMAAAPGVPTEVKAMWDKVIAFLGEPGERQVTQMLRSEAAKPGDPTIPKGPSKPRIQEFLYPTLGFGCMAGNGSPNGGNSMGRALVSAGPQKAPAPGPKRGQAGYVYTSLGTGPALNNTGRPLQVSWINIDNGRTGQFSLKRNAKINATDGPGTFTGIATTGRGRVLSTIYGDVTTRSTTNKKKVYTCTIIPTVGLAVI
ncbi:hypothetical protein [Gordonia sp. CPCC 205333]|uniref:Rv1157c family protein n=1 Tax=Gordonia sp. CPCC 205333 TaxID=3140790 RepID=UPI003AF37BD4